MSDNVLLTFFFLKLIYIINKQNNCNLKEKNYRHLLEKITVKIVIIYIHTYVLQLTTD